MDGIGGGILVAVAAALWAVYLLPTWLRRRQYLATERNAVRLQQTLRILAETAETPEEVRVEATAREVASQQRILRQKEQTAKLAAASEERLALAERRVAEQTAKTNEYQAREAERAAERAAVDAEKRADAASAAAKPTKRPSRRRLRALCSLVLLGGLITIVVGLVSLAFGASAFISLAGVGIGAAAFGGLAVLAPRRPAPVEVAAPAAPVEAQPFEPVQFAEPTAAPNSWTPRALPQPLHLSQGTIAAAAMSSIEAAEKLRRAAAAEALERRARELQPELPTLRAKTPAESNRGAEAHTDTRADARENPYARMGIVDDTTGGFDDLDTVLRRRRAV